LIVEEALEAEAGEALGRGYYEHGAQKRGYRNGYLSRTPQISPVVQIEFSPPGS
jgi:transposase-like protein